MSDGILLQALEVTRGKFGRAQRSDKMDSSSKPHRKNLCQEANFFSRLTFAWAVPLLLHGSRKGLNSNDLTKCLKEDQSQPLGDRLER